MVSRQARGVQALAAAMPVTPTLPLRAVLIPSRIVTGGSNGMLSNNCSISAFCTWTAVHMNCEAAATG